MRIFSLILFCVFYQNLPAQTIPVFQVLYAEKASLNNGTQLKSLDKLLDETILVADSGYLVLIHETGIPLEFYGDTTFLLKEINEILSPKSIRESSTYQKSIGVSYLFIFNTVEAKRSRLNPNKACHDCGPTYPIIYPPLINSRIYYGDSIKIVWAHKFGGNDIIAIIKNVFDEELESYEVDGKAIMVSGDKLMAQNIDFILTFSPLAEKKIRRTESREGYMISKFYTEKINFPYSAKIKTPAAALMAGYFYELASWGVSKEAQAHYELATQLSDKQFYKNMLSNYLKRIGQ